MEYAHLTGRPYRVFRWGTMQDMLGGKEAGGKLHGETRICRGQAQGTVLHLDAALGLCSLPSLKERYSPKFALLISWGCVQGASRWVFVQHATPSSPSLTLLCSLVAAVTRLCSHAHRPLASHSHACSRSLDTGRLNPETYQVFDAVEKHYGIRIEYTFPEAAGAAGAVRG